MFVDKQEKADELMKNLMNHSYPCMSLHGGIDQYDRGSIISDFKSGHVKLLVSCCNDLKYWDRQTWTNKPHHEKTCLWVCNQVRQKQARWRLEISDVETRGIILYVLVANNKGADQTARMPRLICTFVVHIWQKQVFS